MKRNTKWKVNYSLVLVSIAVILGGIFTYSALVKALANSTLYMTPASSSIGLSESLPIDAMINPGSNEVTAVELHITFDQTKLRLDSVSTVGSPFSVTLQNAVIDNNAGTASIIVGVPTGDPLVPVTTISKVATFSFYSLSTVTNSSVAFSLTSQAAALNEAGDVVTTRTPATVTIADIVAPVLSEVTPVPTPTNDTTPDYTFNTNEAGTITYGGDCSSATTSATSGNNTITFNTLSLGTHSNCTITVTDASTNASTPLAVTSFTVTDGVAPVLSEVTPVPTPTNDTTPNYTFNTNEAGTITYGGDCSSATTSAIVGNNTITFNTLTEGVHSNCTITVTDASTNASTPLAVTSFTVDSTTPTLAEITPVPASTIDTTPDYTFSSTEAGTITYGGDCSSATTSAISGNNTITFNTLSLGAHSNCTITVTDASTNASTPLAVTSFTVTDGVAPVLSEVTPVPTPTNDTTPNYTFNTNEAGTITYGGDCSSATTSATSGNNTITFNTLTEGAHSNCTITVTDASTNASTPLAVTSFTVDSTAPTLAEITPVPASTTDTTPDYTFSSTEAGTITYGGDCSSATTSATTGNNTITFNTLSLGTHSNCTITVTDASTNASTPLAVTSFAISSTTPPIISAGYPTGTLSAGIGSIDLEVTTNENATCKYSTTANTLFDSMGTVFGVTGGTAHTESLIGLVNGTAYVYYVRCADESNNKNTSDYIISFSVSEEAEQEIAEEVSSSGSIDISKPKVKVEYEKKSLSSYFKDNRKIAFKGEIKELAGGEVKVKKDSKVIETVSIKDDGSWSLKVMFEKTTEIKMAYYDKNGDEMASKKYKIRVDDERPQFTDLPFVLNKKPGDKLWWKAQDNKGVDRYKYSILGKNHNTQKDYFFIPKDITKGPHIVEIKAFDEAGNKETRKVLVWIK